MYIVTPEVPASSVRTMRIHRKHTGPTPWWHDAVICAFPARMNEDCLNAVSAYAQPLSELGFHAISFTPAKPDIVWDIDSSLAGCVSAFHQHNLKALLVLPGASLPTIDRTFNITEGITTLLTRVRAALTLGIDGIDLGMLDMPADVRGDIPDADADILRSRFSDLVQILLAEIGGDDNSPVLTAASPINNPDILRRQLEDDWFHHLRDTALENIPWDSSVLHEVLSKSFDVHDSVGQVNAWSYSALSHRPHYPAETPKAWEYDASSERRSAMIFFSLSLPGAVYIPWNDVESIFSYATHAAKTVPHTASDDPSFLSRIREALKIRSRYSLGTASFALVSGLPWAHSGVSVHVVSDVMVVLNTSNETVHVPDCHEFLISSVGTASLSENSVAVAPNACAWFKVARVKPIPSPF
ncbi:hypothetical protein [Schaalia sp. lx-260]|uniref:hypothetical protein n=1 Tax=Schaalia sp. lx-260 TaxID=2899082 RepID=UPI001E2CC92F|nr:hypothetical protein [Schaalia sp. lx-260]MCD4549441.1 hypothetical protein [Schaalia sp. lx-260]